MGVISGNPVMAVAVATAHTTTPTARHGPSRSPPSRVSNSVPTSPAANAAHR